MSDDPPGWRPTRIVLPQPVDDKPGWVVLNIHVGNVSQIDPRWYVRLWRDFVWRWRRLLVRLGLRKSPRTRLIKGRDHG